MAEYGSSVVWLDIVELIGWIASGQLSYFLLSKVVLLFGCYLKSGWLDGYVWVGSLLR